MKQTHITTYQAGNLQSKAYRSLKVLMAKLLEPHGLTMIQWAALGTIRDAGKSGITISKLAEELATSLAFTTGTVDVLETRKLVKRLEDDEDKRVRKVITLPAAEKVIKSYEAQLRQLMRQELYAKAGISPAELDTYLEVLTKLAAI